VACAVRSPLDYLLEKPSLAAVLAGGHCVPVRIPRPERWIWHKLYSSTSRQGSPEKAEKDLLQAVTLAAILTEQDEAVISDSLSDAPAALKTAARKRLPALRMALAPYPQTLEQFELGLGRSTR
jgi:hypothetical protein